MPTLRLEAVELIHAKLPLVSPFETSFGRTDQRELILIKIYADGLVGYGESVPLPFYSYETIQTAWHILRDYAIPALMREPLSKPEDAAERLRFVRGHPMARAGLELACWDLFAKAEHTSLKALLGGIRDRVPVGVSIGIQPTPEQLVKVVEGHVAAGYQRIKIKIKPGCDIEPLSAVRQAFPTIKMMADANSAYRLEDAPTLRELDALNLMMIEQPLGYDDIFDHSQLQRQLTTPICLDESIHTLQDARLALELDSGRIINMKVGRVGGYTEARAIHDLCLSKHIPVWCGGMLESGVGRAHNLAVSSLPGFTLPGDVSASERYYREDIVDPPAVLESDGTIQVPTNGPGIGVTLREDVLARYTLATERVG
ncbi:MAG TPA: o-succinylbenzoate synthase [Ktedonobacterales bacterium]|nr:o-succinylbenzoate synthase [Ktedonobacterales bacterium]